MNGCARHAVLGCTANGRRGQMSECIHTEEEGSTNALVHLICSFDSIIGELILNHKHPRIDREQIGKGGCRARRHRVVCAQLNWPFAKVRSGVCVCVHPCQE
jgi:hypothetical protein